MHIADYVETLEQHRNAPAAECDDSLAEEDVVVEPVGNESLAGLIELILKDRPRLHRLIRDPSLQPALLSRLLAISLAAFCFYGLAMTMVFVSASLWPELKAIETVLTDGGGSLLRFVPLSEAGMTGPLSMVTFSATLIVAYAAGLIAATGVALPSLYFHGLLSGLRLTMLDVTLHALKAKATAAVALVGILPIYAAVAMGMVIFEVAEPLMWVTLWLGLLLPFVAGLWGTYSLWVGFRGVSRHCTERSQRRECFLRRLVLAWCAVYSALSPVMIFTLWESLQ